MIKHSSNISDECKTNYWNVYQNKRNIYSSEIKNSHNLFIQNQIESNKKQPKKLWSVLKGLLKHKQQSPETIVFNGEVINSKMEISEKFNSYFVESIKDINKSIQTEISEIKIKNKTSGFFKFKSITSADILKFLNNFQNKSCVENVNKTVILDAFNVIGPVLVNIINESLATGVVPVTWKTSIIIPIPKINGTSDSQNFRPINMLPLPEKILECVVKDQLLTFLKVNNVLVDAQSGFREDHSCETSLNLVIQTWKQAVEANKKVITVFLDFQRAFENVDRTLLLKKLDLYGIRDIEHQWFQSYLSINLLNVFNKILLTK